MKFQPATCNLQKIPAAPGRLSFFVLREMDLPGNHLRQFCEVLTLKGYRRNSGVLCFSAINHNNVIGFTLSVLVVWNNRLDKDSH